MLTIKETNSPTSSFKESKKYEKMSLKPTSLKRRNLVKTKLQMKSEIKMNLRITSNYCKSLSEG